MTSAQQQEANRPRQYWNRADGPAHGWTRRRALAAGAALTGPTLAACAGAGGSPVGGPIKPEGGTVDILIWNPSTARNVVYDAIGKDFTAQSGIPVSLNLAAQGLNPAEKLGVMVAAGEKVDLGATSFLTLPQLADNKWLIDLSSFMARDKNYKSGVPKEVADGLTWKGKPHALAAYGTFSVLAYNKTLFDRAGLKYPDESWTHETLRDAAVKLTKPGVDPNHADDVYGFDFSLGDWLQFVWQTGGQPFDKAGDDPTKGTMSSPAAVEAMTFMADLVLRQQCVARFDAKDRPAMNSGRLGMLQQSLTGLGGLATSAQFPWDIVLFPKGKAGRAIPIGGAGYGISPTSVRPDAAWSFLAFLTSAAGMRRFVTAQLGSPLHKDLEKDYLALPPPPANRKAIVDSQPFLRGNPRSPKVNAAYLAFDAIFPDVLNGKLSPTEGCQRMDQQMTAALQAK